jgi:probable phosphoglycerate mutase
MRSDRRTVYLLRHAAVDYYADLSVHPNDVPLSEEGRAQAAVTGAELTDVPFDRAVATDYPRAVETARIVLGDRPLRIETVEELGEIQGIAYPAEEFTEADYANAFRAIGPTSRFLGGETYGEFVRRVVPAFRSICDAPDWQVALVVSHGVTNRAVLADALGAGLEAFGAIEQDACCVNILELAEEGQMIRVLNHTFFNPVKKGSRATSMELLYRDYRASLAG